MRISSIYGVDFSGAKQAGRTIWIARTQPANGRLRLLELTSLESLCGQCDRDVALGHLVDLIHASEHALWSMDFPFGLPIEIFDEGFGWPGQLRLLESWADGAYDYGLWCLERARALGGKLHLRRDTDTEVQTPFDGYHYRIIYQTFHGMRDVLVPLLRRRGGGGSGAGTVVLPFHYDRLGRARRVLMEACPSSTLKRWRLPHQNYKQATGGALTPLRRRTRRAILDALSRHVVIEDRHRRLIMRDPGGDALDAVIAAAGAFHAWRAVDHRAIARHPRYRHEGYLYV